MAYRYQATWMFLVVIFDWFVKAGFTICRWSRQIRTSSSFGNLVRDDLGCSFLKLRSSRFRSDA
jgi:hypothetical protein